MTLKENPEGAVPKKRQCSGTVKHGPRAGEPCNKAPIVGGTVCTSHGGRAPQIAAAAVARHREERLMAEMDKAIRTYGVPLDIDPGVALLEEVRRTAGIVAWLTDRVALLDAEKLTVSTSTYTGTHPLITLYQKERQHLARVSADAVRCGLEARSVAMAERIGEQVYAAMRAFAAELGHNPDDPLVAEVGIRHLRAVAG